MKKLDQFILKSFIGPFFAILAITIFILVMQFLWLYIDELVGKGLEFKVILEFLMWGSCQVLPLALPLATLLSAMTHFCATRWLVFMASQAPRSMVSMRCPMRSSMALSSSGVATRKSLSPRPDRKSVV